MLHTYMYVMCTGKNKLMQCKTHCDLKTSISQQQTCSRTRDPLN